MRISLHLLTAFRNLRLSLSIFNEVYLLCIWHLSFGIKVWWAKLLKQLSPIYIIENVMFAKGISSNALQNGPLSFWSKQKTAQLTKTLNVGDQTMRFTVWRENKNKELCTRLLSFQWTSLFWTLSTTKEYYGLFEWRTMNVPAERRTSKTTNE